MNNLEEVYLEPSELIAMQDYPPLHSPEAFAAYKKKLQEGEKVPSIVVVPAHVATEHFQKNPERFHCYKKELEQFLGTHPSAKYFMLGGKHRSAAATILGLKISCVVIQNDADNAQVHASEGAVVVDVASVGKDFDATLSELDDHYFKHRAFWSMDEKARAMIDTGDISL